MEIVLNSKRCLCVHSMLQVVDVVLKSILFQRQFTSELVDRLLESDEKFAGDYNRVADVLRDCFRSRNLDAIQEVVIVVGPSCYAPREFFRIPIRLCSNDASSSACGSHCGELTDREVKAFYRSMMTRFPVDSFKKLKRTDRAYIAFKASESIDLSSFEEIDTEESFEFLDTGESKALQARVMLNHECVLEEAQPKERSSCWFRVIPHFKVVP
ncbi:hypothetical protein QR680_009260 [Steinernema hermaphroditum]|uniref:Uncharacterized protein n=1 Tax=Steinernema hermaphroditum TaxID=289476 RepID=A0AA39IM15_9BILA|nr:hypothetical protein QR680_009260 [Steinernema hermaphroditum]